MLHAKLSLARRAASSAELRSATEVLSSPATVLTVQLEQLEAKFALANGEASANELDLYARTSSTLRRLLEAVGLQRRAREIIPDPLEYAREHESASEDGL